MVSKLYLPLKSEKKFRRLVFFFCYRVTLEVIHKLVKDFLESRYWGILVS